MKRNSKRIELAENCPFVHRFGDIPICRLNILPCERVPDEYCNQVSAKENSDKKVKN